jgi:hypothetical protein
MTHLDDEMERFRLARGGPFYELQQRLGLLRENALRAGPRALLYVGIAWGVPLLLAGLAGNAAGGEKPYLLDLGVWARFVIAVGLFILMERQIEQTLRAKLRPFVRAPILAPQSFEPAAAAVVHALEQRDSRLAETICLSIAIVASAASLLRLLDVQTASWAVRISPDGASLTLAGWWTVLISAPMFWFLLLRSLWRHFVWGGLLRALAALDLRLVVTHPDGKGGLAFIGEYPGAYTTFVFAVSCCVAAAVAQEFLTGSLAVTTYGVVMGIWLAMVLGLFAFPLMVFRKRLVALKKRTLEVCDEQALRHHRATEREVLGTNMSAPEQAETAASSEIADPAKIYAAAQSMSLLLMGRSTYIAIGAAALVPLVAAGATQLPFKEILTLAKRLMFL